MSKSPRYPSLILTGEVFDWEADVSDEHPSYRVKIIPMSEAPPDAERLQMGKHHSAILRAPFVAGDVAIYSSGDTRSWKALGRRPTDSGPAGYFNGYIFDGQAWRNFRLSFVSESERRYHKRGQRAAKLEQLKSRIKAVRGRLVQYGRRAYELV